MGDKQPRPVFEETVRELLEAAPSKYVVGLEGVTLRDAASLTRAEKREKVRSRGGLRKKTEVTGLYRPAGRSSGAKIELMIDEIFAPFPAWLPKVKMLRRICIGKVLYHELGHHIHYSGAAMGSKERQADVWRDRLLRDYFRLKYPLVARFARPIAALLRGLLRKRRGGRSVEQA